MKKYLLGSTAIAATLVSGAAMAEEPIKLSLGGYFQAYGIYQDNDAAALRSNYIAQRGRISVSGSTTLDNGITVGVYTQLRAGENADQNDSDGTVKRAYGFFEGSFGRVEIGSNDSAAMVMGYASPDPAPSAGVNSPNFYANAPVDNLAGALGSSPTTYQNWDGQNTKIAYFTPRIGGFQFGVSYTPEGCQTGPSVGGGGCPGYGAAPSSVDVEQVSEVLSLGLNYTNTFGELDTAVSATYQAGKLESSLGASVPQAVLKDRKSFSIGANLGYKGFTFGTSMLRDNEGLDSSNVAAWDAGLKYTTGPWTAGVQYIESTRENALIGNEGDHSVRALMVGGGYALGPGINLGAGYQVWSWDAPLPANRAEANMILVGTVLNF